MRNPKMVLVWLAIAAACVTSARRSRAGDPAEEARESAARVESSIGAMEQAAQAVRARLAHPSASGCVSGPLSGIEQAIHEARDLRTQARSAIAVGDAGDTARSLASIASLEQRVAALRAQAEGCGREVMAMRDERRTRSTEVVMQAEAAPADLDMDTSAYAAVAEESGPAPAPAAAPAAAPPTPPPPRPAGSPYATDAPHEASMLVYTADLTLAVFEVEKGLAAVEAIANARGGYLAQRSDQQITIRVPRPRFAEAMEDIGKLGDVLHRNVSAEDVTDEYVDLELRLRNARATRDRLEALLATAAVKDAIEIQRELAKVTEEIERMEGRMKVLRDRIGFSTITVSFQAAPQKEPVRSGTRLPFPWMQSLGLARLLNM